MKTIHDSKFSVSSGAMNQKFDKFILDRNRERYIAPGRSSDRGRWQRSTGVLMSGLLMIGLLTMVVFGAPTASRAASISLGISVGIAPPPLPVYVQPVCPGAGYIWTPGYWAYDPANGYFWVPGAWVMAPTVGFLWTPGYWGWGGAAFIWHAGYWGPHVGFYGGINYGFGYTGVGYAGGYWRGGNFFYNRSVNNFGAAHFTNVYNRTVVNNFAVNRVSYNGGAGGLRTRPTPGEMAAEHGRHMQATSVQRNLEMTAHNDRAQFASVNHGRPAMAATGRPGEFRGGNMVGSTRAGGTVNPGGDHATNHGSTHSYSSSRSPNPGGGGTHQVTTAHANSPSSHSFGKRPEGTAPGQYHSTSLAHNQAAGGGAGKHQAESHQREPQAHSSRPSGGERGEGHESEPRH